MYLDYLMSDIPCPFCGKPCNNDLHPLTPTAFSPDGTWLPAEYLGRIEGKPKPVCIRMDCKTLKKRIFINPDRFENREVLLLEFMMHPVPPWRYIPAEPGKYWFNI
jgi:hypothetical protein